MICALNYRKIGLELFIDCHLNSTGCNRLWKILIINSQSKILNKKKEKI